MRTKPLFTISKLAKEAGVGVETIRFYERKGLLRQPASGRTSFREYREADVGRIQFIKRAQDIGFTLSEVAEIFSLEENSRVKCSALKSRVDSKLNEVEQKISDLLQMKKSLRKLSKACELGVASVKECKISDCFEKECC